MKTSRRILFVLVLGLLVTLASRRSDASQFDQLVVFGDSLSDTGNLSLSRGGLFPPPELYFNGRFSNGPIWIDYLAATLGVPSPTPSLLNGTNFAWAGAQSGVSFEPYASTLDADPFPLSSTVSITDQIGEFLGGLAARGEVHDPATTLYVVWGGSNDFLIGGESNRNVVLANITDSIEQLIDSVGAQHILVPNIPSLADLPGVGGGFKSLSVSEQTPAKLEKLVEKYNKNLTLRLDSIAAENPDAEIFELDVFALLRSVRGNPELYGFNANTGTPVLDESVLYGPSPDPSLLLLNDPATSLFWGSVEPTTKLHYLLAERAASLLGPAASGNSTTHTSAVPEPTSFAALFWCGLVLLGSRRAARGRPICPDARAARP